MPKITLSTGSITHFNGDAILIPCDHDLTYKRGNIILQYLSDISNKNTTYRHAIDSDWYKAKEYEMNLVKELASIGSCNLGNAVITKASLFNTKHLIFLPFFNHSNQTNKMDSVLLHKALRSAFNLASIYGVTTLAIPLPSIKFPKEEIFIMFIKSFLDISIKKGLQNEEMVNIIIGISEEYKNTSLKEIAIYR